MSQNLPEAIQILRNLLEEAQSNISVIGIVKKEIPDKRINTLMGSYLQLSRELDTMIYALKHDLTWTTVPLTILEDKQRNLA